MDLPGCSTLLAVVRPSSRKTIRSASRAVSARSCVAMSTAAPRARAASISRRSTPRPVGSRPANGSSSITTSGSPIRAQASHSLRCAPFEHFPTSFATVRRSSAARSSARAYSFLRPSRFRTKSVPRPSTSKPVQPRGSCGDSGRYAIPCRRRYSAGGRPPTRQFPLSGRMRPNSTRKRVVFPAPLGPTTAVISPAPAPSVMLRRAGQLPNGRRYDATRPCVQT